MNLIECLLEYEFSFTFTSIKKDTQSHIAMNEKPVVYWSNATLLLLYSPFREIDKVTKMLTLSIHLSLFVTGRTNQNVASPDRTRQNHLAHLSIEENVCQCFVTNCQKIWHWTLLRLISFCQNLTKAVFVDLAIFCHNRQKCYPPPPPLGSCLTLQDFTSTYLN
jgi:hypothetical protein